MPNIQAAMKKTATTQPALARRRVVLEVFGFASFSAGLAMRDRSFLPFPLIIKGFPEPSQATSAAPESPAGAFFS
jgi:hypothetical protein